MQHRIKLHVEDEHLADLSIKYFVTMDAGQTYLKVSKSDLAVHSTLDRTALFRLEFDANKTATPTAHWHVHAERGALSHLLARANAVRPDRVRRPHDLSSMHLPVGGDRFRPCLEDFLEFLVVECGVDANPGWQRHVREGRERWRRLQMRTLTRDLQEEAAETLRHHGWTVEPPTDREQTERGLTLSGW
jgi:hypothetical protein